MSMETNIALQLFAIDCIKNGKLPDAIAAIKESIKNNQHYKKDLVDSILTNLINDEMEV